MAHPELNPIEMIWGTVKRAVSSANANFKLSEVEELTKSELSKYTASHFRKFVEHVMKIEDKFRNLGTILDEVCITDEEDESFNPDISSESDEYIE